jgi:TolB protein
VRDRRLACAAAIVLCAITLLVAWPPPLAPRAQGVDIYVDVTGGGARKLNIAIPEFTVSAGADTGGLARALAGVTGTDLTYSGMFSVVAGTGSIPANDPAALKRSWTDFAAAGAHAGLHGLIAIRPDKIEGEMRLYDLTSPEQRLIATKKFDVALGQPRRLAHKIADEVVLAFRGEPGVADTKIAFVQGPAGAKEIYMADYDGIGAAPVTSNR